MIDKAGVARKIGLLSAASIVAVASHAHAADDAEPFKADEIIVTAQKRAQRLIDVPISVSVVSGDELQNAGASQLADYGGYVPGLQVTNGGTPGQSTIVLRGVSPLGSSATIGTVLDDVPMGSSSLFSRSAVFALDMMPYDIESLEVLRGPQGTLYGASAIGGLLKYTTVKPSLTELGVRAGGEIFGIDRGHAAGYSGQVFVNAPLVTDKAGVTLSYSNRHTPGYIDNITTGQRDVNQSTQQSVRGSLYIKPSEELDIRLSALWQKIDSDDNSSSVRDLDGVRIGDGFSNNNSLREPFRNTVANFDASIDYDFGSVVASSITAYNDTKTVQKQDATPASATLYELFELPADSTTPFDLSLGLKKFSQEFRLTSNTQSPFQWLVGAFYTNERATNVQEFNVLASDGTLLVPLGVGSLPAKFQEYSLFTNATLSLSEVFQITGGLRWSHNKQTFQAVLDGVPAPLGRSSESEWTYSLSPQLHFGDNVMLYAKVASGYRPGGPNIPLLNVPPSVASDSLVSYEAGAKFQTADRSLSGSIAAFHTDWKDIQLAVQFPGGTTGQANAGKAKIDGFEGEFDWRPIPGVKLGATIAYNDGRLAEDTPPELGGLKGDPLPRVPKWSGSLSADYNFDLGAETAGHLRAGLRYRGPINSDVASSPLNSSVDGYTAVDVSADVTFSSRYTLRLYVRNLTNSKGVIGINTLPDLVTNGPVQVNLTPLQPRTVGVAFDVAF